MKRSRSFGEGQPQNGSMPSPASNPRGNSLALMCLPPQDTFPPLKVPFSEPRRGPTIRELTPPPESDNSKEAWHNNGPFEHGKLSSENNSNKRDDSAVVSRVHSSNYPTLKDIACKPIDEIAEWINGKSKELAEDLKSELRDILNGNGGIQQREEFAMLQKVVMNRTDISPQSLMRANRTQLEILVAIKTGIQAFLHPDMPMTQSPLIEIFFYKMCRNMACRNSLPGEDCTCEVCSTKNGFCNACMCTICSKFDFDVNTCRWIGCDVCSHWTHTDCAIRVGQISMGTLPKRSGSSREMLFKCKGCKHTSELFGWVKDVFHSCSGDWREEELVREFDTVRRIFHGSEDSRGKKLFSKSEELLKKLNDGCDRNTVCKEMQSFFQESELEPNKEKNYTGQQFTLLEPQDICVRISDIVHDAIVKMDTVAEEKVRALNRANVTFEACDKELEEKKRELHDINRERARRKQEIEELEMLIRLKVAEADMFQNRADEARREAERLRHLVTEKSEKSEEEYSRFLKLRMNEVDSERRALFEKKMQLHDHPDISHMLALCKIQDLLKWLSRKESTTPKGSCERPL